MANEDTQPRKQLLAFCVAFPEGMVVELKQTFNQWLNSSLTTIERVAKEIDAGGWVSTIEGMFFTFLEKEHSYDIFYTLQYIVDTIQRGKNPSIAYGVPHYGFDLVFVEVVCHGSQIHIIDSYMVQNAFLTKLGVSHGKTLVSLKGFYAQNESVAELARSLLEQNIRALQPTNPGSEETT